MSQELTITISLRDTASAQSTAQASMAGLPIPQLNAAGDLLIQLPTGALPLTGTQAAGMPVSLPLPQPLAQLAATGNDIPGGPIPLPLEQLLAHGGVPANSPDRPQPASQPIPAAQPDVAARPARTRSRRD